MRTFLLLLSAVILSMTVARADEVTVYEDEREILTGPFVLRGQSPQERLDQFTPKKYPAVYLENEFLRCCILPTVGGRLYEVYNKASDSQLFFVNPYLDEYTDNFEGGHPWNLGGVEVNFPYFHHGNSYNDVWQHKIVRLPDGSAGVEMGFTSSPTMQRVNFRVCLKPGSASVFLSYEFENLNPYPWGLAAWIDTMHPKTAETEFILPSNWVAGHGHNLHRTTLSPWPVRDGVDLSLQKNLHDRGDLSEFAYKPRKRFHGCYDRNLDRGAVRLFDPATLPAAKLWTQIMPITADQYYQHFEIWTATSAVMEDPDTQAEFSAHSANDSWFQAWGIGGYVYANDHLALNLARLDNGNIEVGVCGTYVSKNCVISLREGFSTFYRTTFDLDPGKPFHRELPAPPGDIRVNVTAQSGTLLARYDLRADQLPREKWEMPEEPRWAKGLNAAYFQEGYSTLWRRPNHFLDAAIARYRQLIRQNPDDLRLKLDLARAYLKDEQVRIAAQYKNPGTEAEADVKKRKQEDIEAASALLREVLNAAPDNAAAHFYFGMLCERRDDFLAAVEHYRAALQYPAAAAPVYVCLARLLVQEQPDEALVLAQRGVHLYPQSSRAKHMLIVVLQSLNKTEEAESLIRQVLSDDPTDLVAAYLHTSENSRDKLLAGLDAVTRHALKQQLAWLQPR